MVAVSAVCLSQDASSWPLVFAVMFAVFLGIDTGLAAWGIWNCVKPFTTKNGS